MKIYITGPLDNLGATGHNELQQANYRLPAHIIKRSPCDHLEFSLNVREMLRRRIADMMECDQVVTLDHVELDANCELEVRIARAAGIPVVPFWKFMKDHDTKLQDGSDQVH